MKRCIAALALALLAFPGSALAVPDELRHLGPHTSVMSLPSHPTPHARAQALGTDVAAPDQQAPVVQAPGTDVAAVDQQALAAPKSVVHVPFVAPASDASGFDWSDAGIGAGGATCVVVLSLAGAVALRRRNERTSALA